MTNYIFLALLIACLGSAALGNVSLITSSTSAAVVDTALDSATLNVSISTGSWVNNANQQLILFEFDEILHHAFDPYKSILFGAKSNSDPKIFMGDHGEEIVTNYSTACSDPSTIFNSTLVFHNCFALGITSILLQNGLIHLEYKDIQDPNRYLSLGNLTDFNGWAVTQGVVSCSLATCLNSSTNACDWRVQSNLIGAEDPKYNTTERLRRLYNGLSQYCVGTGVSPNSDVIGPGITISYLIQSTIVAGLFITLKISTCFRYFGKIIGKLNASYTTQLRRQTAREGKLKILSGRIYNGPALLISTITRNHDNTLIGSSLVRPPSEPGRLWRTWARCFAALEAVAVDFQEAQTLFVLTIQVASLLFYSRAKTAETSNSYAEANANAFIAFGLSTWSVIPVLLGQTLLHKAGRHWWYTTILTSTVVILGWRCYFAPGETDHAALWAKLKERNPVPQCGGNPSPMTYCGVYSAAIYKGANMRTVEGSGLFGLIFDDGVGVTSSYQLNMFILVLFGQTLGLLLIDQIYVWARQSGHWDTILKHFCFYRPMVPKACLHRVISFIWFAHQLLLVFAFIFTFNFVLLNLEVYTQLSDGWSYGQLVAALVWAPVGLKLIYYILFGVERGVENRLGPFRVRRLQLEPTQTQYLNRRAKTL